VVVITGASGGLGAALCRAFAVEGDRIGAHVHRNRAAGEVLIQGLSGTDVQLFCADLRNASAVRRMFDEVLARWGRLDVLINNAAISDQARFIRLTEAEWDDVLAVNLSGPFFCMREAAQRMSHPGTGVPHIINIVSHALSGRIGQAAYAASKAGLLALTRSAAKEWRTICVNAVAPGLLPTAMTASLTSTAQQALIAQNTLKRSSTFEEVCDFIVRLSRMRHVSGQLFTLDSRTPT
jgi:3-oxoacyl-[acyl-carrier protein] reductase